MQPAFSIKQTLARPENVRFITARLDDSAAPSRTLLARELCQRLELKDPKGDWQIATTCKALRDLEAQGLWQLPAPPRPGPGTWQPRRLGRPVPRPQAVPGRAEQIQGLRLVEVLDEEHCRIWNELMIREHPRRDCRLVGRQLRYLIGSDHGWLGGLGFGSAALYLEDRDDWIGWSPDQRLRYRERVLNMNRFLIRPSVRSENLASRVLGLCARQVPADFQRRYALEPWMLESFVDTADHDGCCYKAANWIQVGQTKGRGRNGSHRAGKSLKDIYLYPLVEDFPGRVGVERPEPIALEPHGGLEGPGWAQQEFGACELGDPRRTRRLVKIVQDRSPQPGA
ncbi:MAG: IS4/Tn5 family transposase DNA-binding protein, partial [Limisphaerales bacterium]